MKALFASALLLPMVSVCALAAPTINPTNHYAYGANVGWIDWRADNTRGAVIGQSLCSGYLYAANCGWIHLGDGFPANGMQYQNNSLTDYGVNHDGSGNLTGYAYGANIGWISFGIGYPAGVARPRVDFTTGQLSGYLYGANIGWISLSNQVSAERIFVATDRLAPDPDTDGDGLSDPWELRTAGDLARLGANTDSDGDGSSDQDEYHAGTNPLNPADCLRITEIRLGGAPGEVMLTWTSQPTRLYRVWGREALDAAHDWVNCTPAGLIPGAAGATTTYRFVDVTGALRFFRVEAVSLLGP